MPEFKPQLNVTEFKPQANVIEFKPQANVIEFKPQASASEFKQESKLLNKLQPALKEFVPHTSLDNNYTKESSQENDFIQEYVGDFTNKEFAAQPRQPAIWNVSKEALPAPFIPSVLSNNSTFFI